MQYDFDDIILKAEFEKARELVQTQFSVEASLFYIKNEAVESIGNVQTENILNLAYRVLYSGKSVCVFEEEVIKMRADMSINGDTNFLLKLINCDTHFCVLYLKGNQKNLTQAFEICNAFIAIHTSNLQGMYITTLKKDVQQAKGFVEGCAELSHEFKNPLNVMLTSTQLLRMKLQQNAADKYEEEYAQLLAFTEDNIMKISRLSSNFLDNAKLQVGTSKLSLKYDNFCSIISRSVEQMSIVGAKDDIKFSFINNVKYDEMCFFDDAKIDKVILNLLSNAIYSICAAKNKNGKITVEVWDDLKCFYIKVEDNGTGIAAEHISSIFEAFFSKRKLKSVDGAGLGLAISKAIVTLHGGEFSVKSFENGACFTFNISKSLSNSVEEDNVLNSDVRVYNIMDYENAVQQELAVLISKINKL